MADDAHTPVPPPAVEPPPPVEPPPRRRHPARRWLLLAIGIAVIVGAYLFGVIPRMRARDRVRDETLDLAIRYVSVVRPQRAAPVQDLTLPGDVQANSSTPVFAR